jgi:DNA-binding XRE family transcriptional regulator
MPAVMKRKQKQKAAWPSDAEILRDLQRIRLEKQRHMEQNKPIMVTKFYPDGTRVRRAVPGHELLATRARQPEPIDAVELKAIRARFKVSQEQFAQWLMVSVNTIRSWEQNDGVPPGPALRLLDGFRMS